jgi:hypothetical protein
VTGAGNIPIGVDGHGDLILTIVLALVVGIAYLATRDQFDRWL